jgi:rRNA maturation endonuclease Nob1
MASVEVRKEEVIYYRCSKCYSCYSPRMVQGPVRKCPRCGTELEKRKEQAAVVIRK